MLFHCCPSSGLRERAVRRPLLLRGHMATLKTTELSQHRLRSLGWQTVDDGQQVEDGRWCLLAMSGRQVILAYADNLREVWSAACSIAERLACEGADGR